MPTFTHGKNTIFQISGTDISGLHNKVDFPRTQDNPETTTFGKSAKCYIPGLKGATISFEGFYDTGTDATLADYYGQMCVFSYYPAGTATGNVLYTGTGIVNSYNVSGVVNDAIKANGSLLVSDAITRSTS